MTTLYHIISYHIGGARVARRRARAPAYENALLYFSHCRCIFDAQFIHTARFIHTMNVRQKSVPTHKNILYIKACRRILLYSCANSNTQLCYTPYAAVYYYCTAIRADSFKYFQVYPFSILTHIHVDSCNQCTTEERANT
jgi:hypothetical protein